jgi:hypothetical protein
MYFARTVKYKGKKYPPNSPFDVEDEDIDGLKKAGGWLLEGEPQDDDNSDDNSDETDDANDADSTEGSPESELEALKEKAKSLGVVVKANWGIKKLTQVISDLTD